RLYDCVLGGEKAIDISGRHLELSGNVGNRRLGEAQPAKQRLRRIHDAGARVVGLDLDLRVHRFALRGVLTDDFSNSSHRQCQGHLAAALEPKSVWGRWYLKARDFGRPGMPVSSETERSAEAVTRRFLMRLRALGTFP